MRSQIFTVAGLITAQSTAQSVTTGVTQSESGQIGTAFAYEEQYFGDKSSWPKISAVADHCCELFFDTNYGQKTKEKETLCHNGTPQTRAKNDKLKSYRCGKDTWLDMDFESTTQEYRDFTGFADQRMIVSSVAGRVENKNTIFYKATVGPYSRNTPAVSLFQGDDCTGQSSRLWSSPDPNGARYISDDLHRTSLGYQLIANLLAVHKNSYGQPLVFENNGIPALSVMVPRGYSLHIFREDQFLGDEQIIQGSYEEGRAAQGELTCQKLEGWFSFRKRSIQLKKNKVGKATGHWRGITASEKLTYKIHVGIQSDNSVTDVQAAAETLTTAMETGWEVHAEATVGAGYGPVSVEATLGGGTSGSSSRATEVQAQASREIASLSSQVHDQTYETTCTPKMKRGGEVGLWQWAISTEDLSVTALTNHTVCRVASAARSPPHCSFYECMNADCTKCVGDEE